MKKIAHYAPQLWAKGGIATYVRRLGAAQEAAGLDVIYLSQNPAHESENERTFIVKNEAHLFEMAEEQDIDILHLHKPVFDLPAKRVTTVRTMHGNQGSCPSGTRFLARSTRPCNKSYSLAGCFVSHFTERCGSVKPAKLKRSFRSIRTEFNLGKQLHTFTVSHFLKDWMLKTGFSSERLHVLNSPAPESPPNVSSPPEEGIPRFLFVGRLVPEKGVAWLLRALRDVKSDIKLDIGGDGALRPELENYCAAHGLTDKVEFHGWVDQDAVGKMMSNARAVIFPSVWQEPAGLVTLEAAAAGRAVIASRAGGIPEYALDEFAFLVQPNNTVQLSNAIDKLAQDYELSARMGACAIRSANSRYALSTFLKKQLSLYEIALGRPKTSQTTIPTSGVAE